MSNFAYAATYFIQGLAFLAGLYVIVAAFLLQAALWRGKAGPGPVRAASAAGLVCVVALLGYSAYGWVQTVAVLLSYDAFAAGPGPLFSLALGILPDLALAVVMLALFVLMLARPTAEGKAAAFTGLNAAQAALRAVIVVRGIIQFASLWEVFDMQPILLVSQAVSLLVGLVGLVLAGLGLVMALQRRRGIVPPPAALPGPPPAPPAPGSI